MGVGRGATPPLNPDVVPPSDVVAALPPRKMALGDDMGLLWVLRFMVPRTLGLEGCCIMFFFFFFGAGVFFFFWQMLMTLEPSKGEE